MRTEAESNGKKNDKNKLQEIGKIPEFTMEEMQAAVDRLKHGKSGDSNGIRAEDIKGCDEGDEGMDKTDLQ